LRENSLIRGAHTDELQIGREKTQDCPQSSPSLPSRLKARDVSLAEAVSDDGKSIPVEGRPFTVVVPTLNEVQALPAVIAGLDRVLEANPQLRLAELIFVDDGSSDGTLEFLERLKTESRRYEVKLLARSVRRGPANAELYGVSAATSEWVLKLDGDGQHELDSLPMIVAAAQPDVDLVLASRYLKGGSTSWPPLRGLISRTARLLAWLLIPSSRDLSDPVSGFYFARQKLSRGLNPSYPRYKLVLYFLASQSGINVREVPMRMGRRSSGESKVVSSSMSYITDYIVELLDYWRVYMASQRRRSSTVESPSARGTGED
jgi:dolichol-phosphate mannosyltransferase